MGLIVRNTSTGLTTPATTYTDSKVGPIVRDTSTGLTTSASTDIEVYVGPSSRDIQTEVKAGQAPQFLALNR